MQTRKKFKECIVNENKKLIKLEGTSSDSSEAEDKAVMKGSLAKFFKKQVKLHKVKIVHD